MEELLRRVEASDEQAQLALDVYLHRLVSLLGGCVATLGGLDALAFSTGQTEKKGGYPAGRTVTPGRPMPTKFPSPPAPASSTRREAK